MVEVVEMAGDAHLMVHRPRKEELVVPVATTQEIQKLETLDLRGVHDSSAKQEGLLLVVLGETSQSMPEEVVQVLQLLNLVL
jgi:hypothetical protein